MYADRRLETCSSSTVPRTRYRIRDSRGSEPANKVPVRGFGPAVVRRSEVDGLPPGSPRNLDRRADRFGLDRTAPAPVRHRDPPDRLLPDCTHHRMHEGGRIAPDFFCPTDSRPFMSLRDKLQRAKETITRRFLSDRAGRITSDDLQTVTDEADRIRQKFERDGPLGRFIGDFQLLVSAVRDYSRGTYRKVPYRTIAVVAAALLYVLNPFDLIPDAIPGVGLLDDATVVGLALAMVERDLDDYKAWKIAQVDGANSEPPALDGR